ncbi:Fatty-acid and retinol-binding protein 8 [Aphelenchoides fujianensis]|nr:Fatty-acid and retinol-binding protein 8 [Aphelenchoides fujianensis]
MFATRGLPLFVLTAAFCLGAAEQRKDQVSGTNLLSFVPDYLKAQLPVSVRNDLAQLTVKDALALRQIAHRLPQFTSLEQIRQQVHDYSPRLERLFAVRHAQARAEAKSQFNRLKPVTQKYLEDTHELAKKFGREATILTGRQSPVVVDDLKQNFPTFAHLLYSPAGRAFLNYLRNQH